MHGHLVVSVLSRHRRVVGSAIHVGNFSVHIGEFIKIKEGKLVLLGSNVAVTFFRR